MYSPNMIFQFIISSQEILTRWTLVTFLKQMVLSIKYALSQPAILDLIFTDMAKLFHPPTTLSPLKQDEKSTGKPSDHNVVVAAPRANLNFKVEKHKKKIHIRPMPQSKLADLMLELGTHSWSELIDAAHPDEKAKLFHDTLIHTLDKHLPEKTVKMTHLDKPWFTPGLKLKYNEMQKEFFKRGKTPRWKQLKNTFKSAKKRASKHFYKDFVKDLKGTNPSKYYKMAKRIGAIDKTEQGDIKIECLEGISPEEQVEKIAESFAAISNEYDPMDLDKLPAYLPHEKLPELSVYEVYRKIQTQKKTKSTLDIDIPEKLRK